MRRRIGVGVGVAIAILTLAGCSVPTPFGMRLNADGTVDYLICSGSSGVIEVDYGYDSEAIDAEPSPEWRAAGPSSGRDVIRYGEEPDGFERGWLEPPPPGWDWVTVSHPWVSAARDELVEDEWVWFSTADYPWIPEHPCDGADPDDLGR
jgi:hypothetical protein